MKIQATQAHDLVQVLRRYLADQARRLADAAHAIPPAAVKAATARNTCIAARGWQTVENLMPARPILRQRGVAAWRILRPQGQIAVPVTGPANPWATLNSGMVAIGALIIGKARGRIGTVETAWSLAFHDHALMQLMRHDGTANPIEAMEEGHDVLLAAPATLCWELMEADAWTLPAGKGAFVIRMRGVLVNDGDSMLLATASEWLPADGLRPQQRVQAARLTAPHDERTLGERALLPLPMRPAAPPFAMESEASPVCDIAV